MKKNTIINWVAKCLFTLALVVLSINFWERLKERKFIEFSWKEEVLISTGDKFWIDRTVKLEEFGGFGSPAGVKTVEMSIDFDGNGNQSEINFPGSWVGGWVPIILDMDELNNWFLIVTWDTGDGARKAGNPEFSYLEFRYVDASWVRQEISKKYIDSRMPANLIAEINYDGESDVGLLEKEKRIKDTWPPVYKCVTDRPLKNIGCNDL